ncbi:MAG: VOC family protein [bacterium]
MTSIPIPARALTPYICCRDAAQAIEFYKEVFGAVEIMRLTEPGGRIGHAELRIGEDGLMLSDEYPEMGVKGPLAIGGTPVTLHLYVADADAVVTRAVAAGANVASPVQDQFYGDRAGTIVDPFGHRWNIGTRQEVVSAEQMSERFRHMTKG